MDQTPNESNILGNNHGAQEACQLRGRPYYPIGSNVVLCHQYHQGYSFYEVVGHTPTGAPRIQRLSVTEEEIENNPAQGSWKLHPQLGQFADGIIHTTRWGKAYQRYMFLSREESGYETRGYLEEYNPATTYVYHWYG